MEEKEISWYIQLRNVKGYNKLINEYWGVAKR